MTIFRKLSNFFSENNKLFLYTKSKPINPASNHPATSVTSVIVVTLSNLF